MEDLPSSCFTQVPFPHLPEPDDQMPEMYLYYPPQNIKMSQSKPIGIGKSRWIIISNGFSQMQFRSHQECVKFLKCRHAEISAAKKSIGQMIGKTVWWVVDFQA